MSLGPDDLVLCAGTLGPVSLREKLEAAADAGFQGTSLFIHELAQARAEGFPDGEVRASLADLGLALAELDPLLDWLPAAGGPQTSADAEGFAGFSERDFLDAAEAVGARSINAALFGSAPVSREAVAEGFAGLCDRARERGLLVSLEFVAFSQVPSLEEALAIVEAAGRGNGGVMFDVMHQLRSGGTPETLRRAAPRIVGVQLDDVPAQAPDDPVAETLRARLLPGEGDADPAGMLRVLDAGGCRAPLGVEVFSEVLHQLPAREAARRAAEAARRVVAEARGR